MKDPKAKALIVDIRKNINGGAEMMVIIDQLKRLREFALAEGDPLVTKVIRLAYERLEEEGEIQVEFQPTVNEEEEEEEMPIIEGTQFEYLLDLLEHSDNKYNREELALFRDGLKA